MELSCDNLLQRVFKSLLFRLPNIEYRLICPAVLVESIHAKIQDANSKLFKNLHQIKAQKLDQLIGPQITLQIRKFKWTPHEGQLSSLDFFIKKCRHDINKLKFNRDTKFSILSSEEWSGLKSLKKRKEMVIGQQRRRSCCLTGRPLPKKKRSGNFLTSPFMLKSTKISL